MARYVMAVDAAHCVGCQTCTVACQMHNALRPGVAWLKVDAIERGRWPDGDRIHLPHACLHCDDAPCVRVCPTGASRQRPDGTVLVDYATCIGCGVCITACPYGARTINTDKAWFFGSAEPAPYENAPADRLGVAEKCTFCIERVERGLEPACVAACPVEVRAFGDVDDPGSDVNRFIAETGAEQVAGTGFYYAVGDRALDPGAVLAERCYVSSGDDVAARGESGVEANPAVLAGAAVAAVGAAAGIGVAAKRSRDHRLHLLDVEDAGGSSGRSRADGLAGRIGR